MISWWAFTTNQQLTKAPPGKAVSLVEAFGSSLSEKLRTWEPQTYTTTATDSGLYSIISLPTFICFLSLLLNVEIGHCTIGISTTFWTSMTWTASLPQRSQTLPVLQSHTGTFGPALWLILTSHQVGLIQHSKPFR